MKKLTLNLPILMVVTAILMFSSCKKATTTDDSNSAQDVATISNATNSTSDDATAAAAQVSSFAGKTEGAWGRHFGAGIGLGNAVLCGATITDTSNNLITITYDGTASCNGVTKSGTITVSLTTGTYWKDQGAVLTVNISNLVVTDVVSGNTYTVNGTHTILNETGGLAWLVVTQAAPNGTTVTHRNQSSNMTVKFSDGSQRTWSVDRTRSWNLNNNIVTVTITSENPNNANQDTWGTNRYGESFTNTITTPIMANSNASCPYRPFQGGLTHMVANRTVTVLFGTNSAGEQVGSATACAPGFYITYSNNKRSMSRFVRYW